MDQSHSTAAINAVGMVSDQDSSSTLNEFDMLPGPSKDHQNRSTSIPCPCDGVPVSEINHQATPPFENPLVPTPSHFEKLYLAPKQAVAGKLRLTFANPTPVALAGFLLCNTPACVDLMGWGGAGGGVGNTSAGIGTYYFLGSMLLTLGGIGEWILGNTFPATVFLTFGGYWGSFGATLTPFFNTINGYGDDTAAFYDSFAFFLIFMNLLVFIYTIAALRTNICLFAVTVCFDLSLPCTIAAYFYHAHGWMNLSTACRIAGAAFGFVASLIAWYLFFSQILEAVDFPYVLPVGDLSRRFKGRSERAVSDMV